MVEDEQTAIVTFTFCAPGEAQQVAKKAKEADAEAVFIMSGRQSPRKLMEMLDGFVAQTDGKVQRL